MSDYAEVYFNAFSSLPFSITVECERNDEDSNLFKILHILIIVAMLASHF